MIDKTVAALPKFIQDAEASLLPDDMKAGLISLMEQRCETLKG